MLTCMAPARHLLSGVGGGRESFIGRLEGRSARRAEIIAMLRSLLSSVVAVSLPRWPGAGRSRDERGHQRTESEGQLRTDQSQSPRPDQAGGREAGDAVPRPKLRPVHGALGPHALMCWRDKGIKRLPLELTGLRAAWAMKEIIAEESPAEHLSPAQTRGDPATEATDVYAFAVILY